MGYEGGDAVVRTCDLLHHRAKDTAVSLRQHECGAYRRVSVESDAGTCTAAICLRWR